MIKDADRYYGSAISSIIEASTHGIHIRCLEVDTPGFYVVDEKIPIYIKYSTSRNGPWTFNFQQSHQEIEDSLYSTYGECIVIFVCGKDGIAAVDHKDFRKLLDENFEEQESVTIRRRHNEMYKVRGKNGSLEKKVSRSSLEEVYKRIIERKILAAE